MSENRRKDRIRKKKEEEGMLDVVSRRQREPQRSVKKEVG